MSRYAAQIDQQDLLELVLKASHNPDHSPDEGYGRAFDPYTIQENCPKLAQDLKKVEFDWENYEYLAKDEFSIWVGMLGPRTLGRFSYIGVMAGGDWEHPLYLIIYLDQDGKTLRAYIPTDGNTWNRTTKTAIGNDEDADDKYLKKHFGNPADPSYQPDEADFDKVKIEQDILKRIQVK